MIKHYRPRRSMLYVPCSVARYLEKSRELPVDSLILDLEDPVLPELKSRGRRAAGICLSICSKQRNHQVL